MIATFRNKLPMRGELTLASLHMTSDLGGTAGRYLSWAGSVVPHSGAITGPALDPNVWSKRRPLTFGVCGKYA
jgi:hypothetical protein